MTQIDMFEKLNWPNDFDGAHQVGGVAGFGATHPGYGAVPPETKKIYESPDKGQTVYERDFGADPSTRRIVKTAIQQQWKIVYNSTEVSLNDALQIL